MAFYKIRPKSGTAQQWSTANPVLGEREIGYEYPSGGLGTGIVKMKMGDGVTAWNDLPYAQVVPLTAEDIVTVDSASNNKVPSAGYVKKKFDDLKPKVYTEKSQTNGFECQAVVEGHTVTFIVRGTAAVNLGTSDNYAFCGSFPQVKALVTVARPRIKRVIITPKIFGQLVYNHDTGYLRLGYTFDNNGSAIDIPKDTVFYLEETFVM